MKGVSHKKVVSILKRCGSNKFVASEGGRTNRSGQGDLRPLFDAWQAVDWTLISESERNSLLRELQSFLVARIGDFHNRQRIKLVFTLQTPTRSIIRNLVEVASISGKSGAVAQHLVGAKLQLRFPTESISNEGTTSADLQTKRHRDFQVGETVFHVTMAPQSAVFLKCNENLKEGLLVYLIVPQDKLEAARAYAMEFCKGQVAVEALESFVAQNLDEIGAFRVKGFLNSLGELIQLYNYRVAEVELDKSIMIDLPESMRDNRY